MNSINSPSIRTGDARPTAEPLGKQQGTAITIPATDFSHYHVIGDGDCLFRAMHMGLTQQPGVEPSHEQIMGLRLALAGYVCQHQNILASHPAFEGLQGLQNLYDLLLTPGQWNHNAGDLVVPLLAQVTGRPLAVLQPDQQGSNFGVRQVFPADNPTLPPSVAYTGAPTIYLAHINGNHYGLLEERYPNTLFNALSQTQNNQHLMFNSSQSVVDEGEPSNNSEKNVSHKKRSNKILNEAQEKEMAQLWQDNPAWSELKISQEYKRRNPELMVTKSVAHKLRARHPDLQNLELGFVLGGKKVTLGQKKEMAQLWSKNLNWNYKDITREFNERHPGLDISTKVARGVKKMYLSSAGISPGSNRKLSNAQESSLVQLWGTNPSWGERKVAKEFSKRNPGVNISGTVVHGLKGRYPGLRGLGLGSVKKEKIKLSDEQEQAMLKLWRANPHWGRRKIAQEFMQLNPELLVTRNVADRLRSQYPNLHADDIDNSMSSKAFTSPPRMESRPHELSNRVVSNTVDLQDFSPEEPIRSPTIFDDLEAFEDIPTLKD